MIYFTADLHFYHKNILKYNANERLNIKTLDEMHSKIIEIWNNTVCDNDTVYILGDVSFAKREKTSNLVNKLNGRKHLILGNHDGDNIDKSLFESVSNYKEIKIDGKLVCLFHYPITEWRNAHYGSYHLHGHTHGSYKGSGRIMDVGIDTRGDMTLWSWESVNKILSDKDIILHHNK